MAQAAVERTHRQEDRSATGSFLLLPFRFSIRRAVRARRGANDMQNLDRKQKRKRALDPRGERPLRSRTTSKNHSDCGGRTSSEREVMFRYCRWRKNSSRDREHSLINVSAVQESQSRKDAHRSCNPEGHRTTRHQSREVARYADRRGPNLYGSAGSMDQWRHRHAYDARALSRQSFSQGRTAPWSSACPG